MKSGDKASAVLSERVEEQAAAMSQRMDQQTSVIREFLEKARKPTHAEPHKGSVSAAATPRTDAKKPKPS